MPAGQPFTKLCQSLAKPRNYGRVDLHLHTTFSDGVYTPAQVVELARRSGLAAIAVTDHDTLAGIGPTRLAAADAIDVVSGVEITAQYRGRELHLLGYCFDANNVALKSALADLQTHRSERFAEMIERLHTLGVHVEEESVAALGNTATLGRRHLAALIVQTRKASTVREAFQRYLGDHGRACVPKARIPVAEAIALLRQAGGVASWAHPNYDCNVKSLTELKSFGLGAVEADYPAFRSGRVRELRNLAASLGLAVTGGSDCHGPDEPHRAIGTCSITRDELMHLNSMI